MNLKSFLANETPLVAGETLIEANAGTGKTYTLCKIIERLIVEENIPVERILAVTFTKSAAEELSERVRKNLKDRKSKLAQHAGSEHSMLARAISNFDEARISTLHAFCKRLLEDFSFECGVRTESDLQTDDTPLRKQVALDFRRATFLDCNPFLAAISFTGALTTENLQNRNDQRPSSELAEEQDLEQLCEDATEQYFSLVGLWKSELKEIESFLFQHSANGAVAKECFEELKMRFLQAFKSSLKVPDFSVIRILRIALKEELKAKSNADNQAIPSFFSMSYSFLEKCKEIEDHLLVIFDKFSESKLHLLKAKLNLRTFNDLQTLVAESLTGKRGKALKTKVFAEFDAVLVDEFQDTDPVQFDILRMLFSQQDMQTSKLIFYIGDPKQSIYKFRGADLNNYLKIKDSLDPKNIFGLTKNYRSHPSLVTAVNNFLELKEKLGSKEENPKDEGGLFLDSRISFDGSTGDEDLANSKFFNTSNPTISPAAFNLRYAELLDKKETPDETAKRILNDMAREIIELLDPKNRAKIGGNQLKGSDIAILCRSNKQIDAVYEVLSSHLIPCTLLANRSIFQSQEALDIKCLMQALLEPGNQTLIRRVMASSLFSFNSEDFVTFSQDTNLWDFWANRFSSWSSLWKTQSFSYAFQAMLSDSFDDLSKIHGQDNSLELEKAPIQATVLQTKGGERRMTNYLHLGELLYQAELNGANSSPRNLLLWYLEQIENKTGIEESDCRLESDEDAIKVLTIHKSKGLQFPVTFIPFSWRTSNGRGLDDRKEEVRALYVALTRATSRLYLYHKEPKSNFKQSALSRCIPKDFKLAENYLSNLSSYFSLQNINDKKLENDYCGLNEFTDLKPSLLINEIPFGRITSSFSQKIKGDHTEKDHDESEIQKEIVSFEKRRGAHTFPAGTQAGNFFHEIFEVIDYQKEPDHSLLEKILSKHGLPHSLLEDAGKIILSTLSANLASHEGTPLKLNNISAPQRLPEIEFHLLGNDFCYNELATVINEIDPNCKFAGYLKRKSKVERSSNISFFKGFIDLTFEHDGKYYVLDWKSNLLSGEQNSFDQKGLLEEMEEADYILQYHLYLLALHRHLQNSHCPNYDYNHSIGGAYYLFLRGLVHPISVDDGIFFDKPPRDVMLAFDSYLTGQIEEKG